MRRLGETEERRVDLRVVAATHRDLPLLAGRGDFRADLLFRLGRTLRLPPLRERRGDVLLLARAFLREHGGGAAPPPVLDPDAESWLLAHPLPGNVRQLKCLVLGAAALCEGGVIRVGDLRDGDGGGAGPGPERALPGRCDGPCPAAAEALLGALRRRGPLPTAWLVRETGLPRRTVQRALAELVRSGGVVRGGSGPATRYLAAGG